MALPAKGWADLTTLRFDPVEKSNIIAFTKQWTKYYEGKSEPTNRRDAEFFWAFEIRTNLPEGLEYERLLAQVYIEPTRLLNLWAFEVRTNLLEGLEHESYLAQKYIEPIPLLNLNSSVRSKN